MSEFAIVKIILCYSILHVFLVIFRHIIHYLCILVKSIGIWVVTCWYKAWNLAHRYFWTFISEGVPCWIINRMASILISKMAAQGFAVVQKKMLITPFKIPLDTWNLAYWSFEHAVLRHKGCHTKIKPGWSPTRFFKWPLTISQQ